MHKCNTTLYQQERSSHSHQINGTSFTGAERELREAVGELNHERIQGALILAGVEWSFNPPAASYHGGVWERMICIVRRVLNSLLHQRTLYDHRLHTVMCEVKAILNDCPITQLSDDPIDLEVLTPNYLLLLKGKPALPPGLFKYSDMYVKRRWKQAQYISDLFWKRWTREYIAYCRKDKSGIRGNRVWLLGMLLSSWIPQLHVVPGFLGKCS